MSVYEIPPLAALLLVLSRPASVVPIPLIPYLTCQYPSLSSFVVTRYPILSCDLHRTTDSFLLLALILSCIASVTT